MNPLRNVLANPSKSSWPSRFISWFTVVLLLAALSVITGTQSQATSYAAKSEAQKDIDRLFQLAADGENREEAIDGIAAYVENGEIELGEQSYAVRKLEELAAPELKDYLLGIAEAEIHFANSLRLRSEAYRAYWVTWLAEAKTEAEEERILVDGLNATLTSYIDVQSGEHRHKPSDIPYGDENSDSRIVTRAGPSAYVRRWAADELCQRGHTDHLDIIIREIKRYPWRSNAAKEIDQCQRQIEIVNKFDTKLQSMEYVIESIDRNENVELTQWALEELFEMERPEADEVIFENVLYALDEQPNRQGPSTLNTSVWYLHRRNWTLEDYVDRGVDPANRRLQYAIGEATFWERMVSAK
ncbi:MAG: hypothetical protein GKS02_10390 [Alphaproteobacteria bacterium]|nr:hypothetical protein [Alphaproteobacteria bacterium]